MIKAVVSSGDFTRQFELEGGEENALRGKSIGDEVDGDSIGLSGYTLKVTGGSDEDGFAMRKTLEGGGREELLVKGGQGFNPERDGERRRKSVHGAEIDSTVVQVNLKTVEEGDTPLDQVGEEGEEE